MGKARFVLEGRTCIIQEVNTGAAPRAHIGSLALGGRRYVILVGSDGGKAPQLDLINILSPRELEIAFHIAAGRDCKLVAQRLRISFHTVRVHLGRIYAKLGLHKQTELAALIAAQFGAQDKSYPSL